MSGDFITGAIFGAICLAVASFIYTFARKTEEKDKLLAESTGKKFQEGISLVEKGK